MLGLYDLNATVPLNFTKETGQLFDQGMISLKKMLMFFDTGSGSIYDLRHIVLGMISVYFPFLLCILFTIRDFIILGVEPNIARWDYHATHVNQLLLLATIDNDPLIARVAERWRQYMIGKRAPHN